MKKTRNILTIVLCAFVLFGLAIFAWIKAPTAYSPSERRTLAQLPKISAKTLKSGKFMSDFESYSLDQMPMRDGFRSFKAAAAKYVFQRKDNHGLYSVGNYVSKLEYPLNAAKIETSIKKMNAVSEKYLNGTDCRVYLSIIPDKNYFLAPLGGYPVLDYEALYSEILSGAEYDEYIDISDLISLEDFYWTDQHWRQECIADVAERIGSSMRPEARGYESYTDNVLDNEFYGAYVGQAALPFEADTIHYLTNEVMDSCKVTSYNTGAAQESQMYDMSKAYGRDPYEMFLSGSDPLLVIENPKAETDRELVVFRDSFGSSLIPLLTSRYAKITVVDLRYIRSDLLGNFIEFTDQDVLFMYSTLILNNNISM